MRQWVNASMRRTETQACLDPATHRPSDCDIIVLVWNQPALTRRCVESVLAHTRTPARLLLVDNGSDAPTQAYLASVASHGSVQVQTLRNDTNEGFARGMNRGLRASGAPWVCLLNNDTIVTPGWLTELPRATPAAASGSSEKPRMETAGPEGSLQQMANVYRQPEITIG